MNKIISIIVPTYNMEAYLRQCLSSLLIGKDLELVEVLVVNDGSTDDSAAIASSFVDSYPEVFKVVNKANGHYGSCINAGLEVAAGKYIKVLDADDSFDTAAFELLVGTLKTVEADAVLTDTARIQLKGKPRKSWTYNLPKGSVLDFEAVCLLPESKGITMHGITYRTEMLRQMGYRQTEGIAYTDQQWSIIPMVRVRTLYYLAVPVYRYLLGREGQSMCQSFFKKHFKDHVVCAQDMLSAFRKLKPGMSENKQVFVRRGMATLLNIIYKNYLVNLRGMNLQDLAALDRCIAETDEQLYADLNTQKMSSGLFKFKYIKRWRTDNNSASLKLLIVVYRFATGK